MGDEEDPTRPFWPIVEEAMAKVEGRTDEQSTRIRTNTNIAKGIEVDNKAKSSGPLCRQRYFVAVIM